MKRAGYLFEKIVAIDNIKLAITKASKGKRNQKRVQHILDNIDHYAYEIRELLVSKRYVPSPYIIETLKDGPSKKVREISKPKFFPDQVVHWALMLGIQSTLQRGMYYYSCGSIPGKGSSFGQNTIRKWLKDKKSTKYCLKVDVRKYYPSIPNEVLKSKFRRVIKDNDTLWLIDSIIDSANGLPIGNYTSQWFANFYLSEIDHFIKGSGQFKYVRYVDDLVIFGANKKKLHQLKKGLDRALGLLGLVLKENWQVFKTDSRPLDFLGLKFYRTYVTLRSRNSLRIRRRAKRIYLKGHLCLKDAQAMISYWGWIKRSDSYHYYHKYFKPYVSLAKCREVISRYGKANSARTGTGIRSANAVCSAA